LKDGEYIRLGNREIIVKDGIARLGNGSLAGSTLRMNDAVRNAVQELWLSMEDAVPLASTNKARSLGLEKEYGSLEPGKKLISLFTTRLCE